MSTAKTLNNLFVNNAFAKGFWMLFLVLAAKALFIVFIIQTAGIYLSPDEAQYWTWSQNLDWGYYSKPPGIAWQIWLGTQLFGQTELGVRFFAVVIGFFQPLAVFTLARSAGLSWKAAFYSGLVMALVPLGWIGSLQSITDGGMVLFWTLASASLAASLNKGNAPNPLIIGLFVLCGALFKWPIYFFWIFYLIFRREFFSSQSIFKFLVGVAVSLLGLLPSLFWNWSHDWVTFRHVAAILQGGHGPSTSNAIEFLGAQMLLLTPPLFILAVYTAIFFIKNFKLLSPSLAFISGSFFGSLLAAVCLATFQKVQGNWIVFCYPLAIVWLAWFIFDLKGASKWWVKSGFIFSGILICLVFIFSQFPSLPYNPLKHQLGWDQLKIALQKHGYDPEEHFLVSDKYQTTSLLSFYSEKQKQAYFLNLGKNRNNQFSYWPTLQQDFPGGSGFFVWIENQPHLDRLELERLQWYLKELGSYFESVRFVAKEPLVGDEKKIIKGALLFYCKGCKEAAPSVSDLY